MKRLVSILLFFLCLNAAFAAAAAKPFITVTIYGSTAQVYINPKKIVKVQQYTVGSGVETYIYLEGNGAPTWLSVAVSDSAASIVAACLAAES